MCPLNPSNIVRDAAGSKQLQMVSAAPMAKFNDVIYYRVPFWQATDLIGNRQVSLA